ncbi:MAG: RidA family protein [Elusimicrobia bacterium]|nr:RidA family protein [Elusimicrobiota bacterium]
MKSIIGSKDAPAAIGPYSQAVRAGDYLYCSGQIAIDPPTGGFRAGSVGEQTRQALENLGAVLRAAGASYGDVVKTTVFLVDLAKFGEMNEAYGSVFKESPPARSTVQVSALPKGAAVEIEAVAYLER